MSTTALIVISNLGTLIISLLSVVFITGRAFGEVRSDIATIKHDIAQIQGMFVTRVRSDRVDKELPMTTPSGDQPDWQTLVTPQILNANVIDQQANLTSALLSSGAPFRVWGLWIRVSVSTNGTYAGGQAEMRAQLQDGAANVLLEAAVIMSAINQGQNQALAIPLPGFTPAIFGGSYSVVLVTSIGLTNLTFRASGGMFYSQP